MQACSVLQLDGTARVYRNDAYRGRNGLCAQFCETNPKNLIIIIDILIFNGRGGTFQFVIRSNLCVVMCVCERER